MPDNAVARCSTFQKGSSMKVAFGFVLAFTIGVVCRVAFIPVPAPQALIGAFVVLAMTLGYIGTDRLVARRVGTSNAHGDGPVGERTETRP
jgi:XapX domain-containing protein